MNSCEAMAAMLQYRRPHKSKTERRFIQRFLTPLGVIHDRFGNRYKRIGTAPIMYSSHTDSVHREKGLQDIAISKNTFKLARHSKSNCLGADNGAGVWLMREMILANKPGLYIFHRGEEVGCLGSKFITKHTPELVDGIQAAIAFDRRNTKSIITHMWNGRCCSEAFSESLAKELNLGHTSDSGGTVTDTGQYTGLIPECTNVSVGFQSEHSSSETLDMNYLIELRQSMLEYDWEKLVIKRKAGEYEPRTYHYAPTVQDDTNPFKLGRRWNYTTNIWEVWHKEWETWIPAPDGTGKGRWEYNKKTNKLTHKPAGFLSDMRPKKEQGELLPDGYELGEEAKPGRSLIKPQRKLTLVESDMDTTDQFEQAHIIKMVRDNPDLVATLLGDYGVSADELADFLHLNNGIIPYQMLSGEG